MKLDALAAPRGATRRRKRLGLGESSGHGKTSGRGHKGQKSRSGYSRRPEFEGGQMPLIRRVPKRGFTNSRRKPVEIINIEQLNQFAAGTVVDTALLAEAGLVSTRKRIIKILGEGTLKRALTVKAHRFSKSAVQKIADAGGATDLVSQ